MKSQKNKDKEDKMSSLVASEISPPLEAEKSEVFCLKVVGVAIVYSMSRKGPRLDDFRIFPGLEWYYEKIKRMYSALVAKDKVSEDFFEGSRVLRNIWIFWRRN